MAAGPLLRRGAHDWIRGISSSSVARTALDFRAAHAISDPRSPAAAPRLGVSVHHTESPTPRSPAAPLCLSSGAGAGTYK